MYLMVVPFKRVTCLQVTKILVELTVCPVTLKGGLCSAVEKDDERRFGLLNMIEEVGMK